jgi:hypothetical protein
MVAEAADVTDVVVMETWTEFAPAGMVTLAGTLATDGLSLTKETWMPPWGAG